jgi:hypothetical protein
VEIYGIGRQLEWGEWWLLIYHRCGHEHTSRINRVTWALFDHQEAEQQVISDYAESIICRPPKPLIAS